MSRANYFLHTYQLAIAGMMLVVMFVVRGLLYDTVSTALSMKCRIK